MDTPPKTARIPRATIQRLATYIQVLENLARDGTQIISSTPLAEACGVNGSQIRKDLAYFGEFGIRGVGYNVTQSKIAIGSGGLTGKGFLQGTQTKYNFVPEQSTDFIFCTVGEEWGFVGSTIVILLFLAFILRIVKLAERQRSTFSRVYGYGVASILFFHVAVNIGMTIGMMPVIGIPLPFFSYGGSSLWAFTILIFIFLRLDSNRLQVFR